MRHAGLENCKMGPSASENAYEQAKKRSGKKRRAAPIAFPDVLGHVDDVEYHTVTSMPHTAAVARSSCISAPPTSATHSGTQPAPSRRSSSRSCPGGARAGAAASARHHQPPRPDRRTPPGCIDRGVLAGACASIPGPVGAAPVRGRSRASAELRANRERLWPQRRRPRPPHGAPGRGERGCGARFASLNSPATAAAHSRPADRPRPS